MQTQGKVGFEKKRILIVDDNKTFIMYTAMLLKRMGFDIIPAENGLEAIKLAMMIEPDLIMLDVMMPVMDGVTALRHLKEDKQVSKIPVVMVSIEYVEETVKKCKEMGASGFLTKPLKIDTLHEILQDCIFLPLGIKRKYLRLPYNEKVTVTYNGALHELYAESISEGGIYLIKKDPFPVGSEVEITLPLGGKKTLLMKGNVIYTKGLYGNDFRIPPGMAIEFKGLATNDAMLLSDFVKRLIAKDILESQEEAVIEIEDYETD